MGRHVRSRSCRHAGRALVRRRAPAVVAAVHAPPSAPRVADDIGSPESLTPEQDYVTTCTLYVSSEGKRYVRTPKGRSADADQYDALFPGVTRAVHASIDELGRDRILQIEDEERWGAALSTIGPRVKGRCAAAYRTVSDEVRPIDGVER